MGRDLARPLWDEIPFALDVDRYDFSLFRIPLLLAFGHNHELDFQH